MIVHSALELPKAKAVKWNTVELGQIAELRGRIGWKGLTAKEYTERGPRFLSVHSLNYGDYVDFRDAFHISQERYDESPEIMLQKDDILICKDGAGIGKLGIVPEVTEPTTINSSILLIRAGHHVEPKYLYYCLLSPYFQKIVQSRLEGATTPHLYQRDITEFPVELAPLEEQKRIVAMLDQAFAALDRARALAEANLTDASALFSNVLEDVFGTRESWDACELGERLKFIDYRGKTPPKAASGVRLITAKNVRMGYIKRDPEEFIPLSAYDAWMTRGFPAVGDVLFTTEAPLANVAELDTDERVVIGQRLITFKTDPEKILPRFLKWSLISPQMQRDIHSQATGATVLGIKAKLLKKIRFYVPRDLAVQQTIASTCEEAFSGRNRLVSLYNQKLADIASLRQTLLEKAFAGELT